MLATVAPVEAVVVDVVCGVFGRAMPQRHLVVKGGRLVGVLCLHLHLLGLVLMVQCPVLDPRHLHAVNTSKKDTVHK